MFKMRRALLLLLVLALGASSSAAAAPPAKYAAISLLPPAAAAGDGDGGGLRAALGVPRKHPANPLFTQDRPWETRIDNGYPNVVPPQTSAAAAPSGYQLWYGNQATNTTRNRYSLLYANSTDGLTWKKPNLGIFDFGRAGFPNFAHLGARNNVLVEGDGVGVYYDAHEPDPARRYKAIGDACWLSPTLAFDDDPRHCNNLYDSPPPPVPPYKRPRFYGLIASSPDGLTFPTSQVVNISWPPPHKWDTHSNVFWDAPGQTYVVTTRSVPVESDGLERETSLARSVPGGAFAFDTATEAPPVVVRGNVDHQPYAQITFPWLNLYLGLTMLYDQVTGDQVHCRLTYAVDVEGPWRPVVGADIIGAPDFLPLGPAGAFDSHVIFAAARPFRHDSGSAEWMYYMGGDAGHNSGERKSSFALATLRPDGWAAVVGPGTWTTPSWLTVTDAVLTASVDFGTGGGALSVGVLPEDAGDDDVWALKNSISLTANATDAPMRWRHRTDLAPLVGKRVKLEVRLEGAAMVYALGFTPE